MKKLFLIAVFTFGVGIVTSQAQVLPTEEKDKEQTQQETVLDNSNIPDTTIIDDSGVIDSNGTKHSNHDPSQINRSNDINKEKEEEVLGTPDNLEGK